MRFDDALNLLGTHRDYLILALAVLVLVEGGIIVLWARRAVQLKRELKAAVSAAEAAKAAAERAAASVSTHEPTYKAAQPKREVYSVAARETVAVEAPPPVAATAPEPEPLAATAPEPEPVAAAEPEPAEYVTPAAQQAASWVLPEVEATTANGDGGNGHHAESNGNGWFPAAASTETNASWSNADVPVEPAADFAVLRETDVPPAPPAHQRPVEPVGPEETTPSLTVLDGTKTWTFPAQAQPAAPSAATPAPSAPMHIDPALLDTSDDFDDGPISGDVLLVEDDPTIAKLYRVLLESRGYTVRHAVDGLDGLDRANEKRPDLVLLDIMMPRMNGIAFLQALRRGEMRDVPVVVLSNFMEKQLVDDAMELGALEYMVKAQTRPEALVGALPHWLRGERAFSY